MQNWRSYWLPVVTPLLGVLVLASCSDNPGPVELEVADEVLVDQVQAHLTCQVDVRGSSMSCDPRSSSLPAGVSAMPMGGQGIYYLLESSNVAYDAGAARFSADVTVQNRLLQPIGTADGGTLHPEGVRIFFVGDIEVTEGTGEVVLTNEDGKAAITASDQPYFEYGEVLRPGVTSAPRSWEWDVPSTVESFSFHVGVSTTVPDEGEVEAGIGLDASTFAVGLSHTCGLSYDNELYCWGDMSKGQFGNGQDEIDGSKYAPYPVMTSWGGDPFVQLSSFADQNCGITTSGEAYCWGDAEDGSHGDGTGVTEVYLPQKVDAGTLRFISISVGGDVVCAVSTDGEAYCWGDGSSGVLGDENLDSSDSPVLIPSQENFTQVGAGFGYACALTDSGEIHCWGAGDAGQLGNGTTDDSAVPTRVGDGSIDFDQLSVGAMHVCGLAAGDLHCWGNNDYGQLGDGSANSSAEPVLVTGVGSPFTSVSAGGAHVCAVATDGAVYCWGSGGIGQLGNGKFDESVGDIEGFPPTGPADEATPTPTAGPAGETFHSVGTGIFHSCASTESGRTYCWGLGHAGQLANGVLDENRDEPTLADTSRR